MGGLLVREPPGQCEGGLGGPGDGLACFGRILFVGRRLERLSGLGGTADGFGIAPGGRREPRGWRSRWRFAVGWPRARRGPGRRRELISFPSTSRHPRRPPVRLPGRRRAPGRQAFSGADRSRPSPRSGPRATLPGDVSKLGCACASSAAAFSAGRVLSSERATEYIQLPPVLPHFTRTRLVPPASGTSIRAWSCAHERPTCES